MARRRKRRNAGPPPVGTPKRAAGAEARRPAAGRLPGEPLAPSVRGVVIRAAIVAAIFYPYLVYVVDETATAAALVSLLAFGLMVPLGLLLDRFRYSRQMKRWNEKRARQPGS
jgi:predicted secreted protein